MPTRDLIASAIAGPIDWGRFEELVYAILVADDFPRLRKLGGTGDKGVDSQEEAFFDDQRKVTTVVQVSSERAQRGKVRKTIATLRLNGIECVHLVFVTRHPVTSDTRSTISDEAAEDGVSVDIRDDQYLIAQLSKPGSPIFARFFGTLREQLTALLDGPDPLQVVGSKLKRALLASLGAYVLSPRARLARTTLFEKTVLAAIAAAGGDTSRQDLLSAVAGLLPGEAVDPQRLDGALNALERQGSCTASTDRIACSESALGQFVQVSRNADIGYRSLVDQVVAACRALGKLDDAQVGYLERNLRRAVLSLLRACGPLTDTTALAQSHAMEDADIRAILARDLPIDVGRTALTALSSFVQNPEQATLLAPLVRSYAALAIRNTDPVGRAWQQGVLSRKHIALDTDAVLFLIVDDVPEHRPLVAALQAFQAQGVAIEVAAHVLEEAVTHIGHADRTFRRFANTLLRLPESAVDHDVWHVVVRGYYYACEHGYKASPETYWAQYYDPKHPAEFINHILSQRLHLRQADLSEIPKEWRADCEELQSAVLERRERGRWKASFRFDSEMQDRVLADVCMILHLAVKVDDRLDAPCRGYLASDDRAFPFIESHGAWRERGNVVIPTRALPELASFVCGVDIEEDDLIRLLFDPVIAAAADHLKEAITALASVGVDLKNVPLVRLEWDLRHILEERIRELSEVLKSPERDTEDRTAGAALAVAKAADSAGYPLAEPVGRLVKSYEAALATAVSEKQQRIVLQEQLKAVAQAARASTKKGRRRINRVLRELGIELDITEGPTEDE